MSVSIDCMSKAYDEGFNRRVKYFMQKKAFEVLSTESHEVDNHAERVIFALKILSGEANTREYAIAAVTNGTIATAIGSGTDPNDNDLGYVVMTEMFNAMAGID